MEFNLHVQELPVSERRTGRGEDEGRELRSRLSTPLYFFFLLYFFVHFLVCWWRPRLFILRLKRLCVTTTEFALQMRTAGGWIASSPHQSQHGPPPPRPPISIPPTSNLKTPFCIQLLFSFLRTSNCVSGGQVKDTRSLCFACSSEACGWF